MVLFGREEDVSWKRATLAVFAGVGWKNDVAGSTRRWGAIEFMTHKLWVLDWSFLSEGMWQIIRNILIFESSCSCGFGFESPWRVRPPLIQVGFQSFEKFHLRTFETCKIALSTNKSSSRLSGNFPAAFQRSPVSTPPRLAKTTTRQSAETAFRKTIKLQRDAQLKSYF